MSAATSSPTATCWPRSRAATRSSRTSGSSFPATTTTTAPTATGSSTARTTTARARSACSRSPKLTPWLRRRGTGRSDRSCSPRSTPRSAGCSAHGRSSSGRRCPWIGSSAVLNMDMVGRDEEVPEGGGPRFRGLPVQSAESNRNAVNLLGHSRSASLTQTIERANAPLRPDAQEGPGQQQLEPPAPQRPVAVPPEGRAGRVFPHRPAPRLPHARKTGPRRSTTRRWSGSSAWCTRQAGTWPSNPTARGSI